MNESRKTGAWHCNRLLPVPRLMCAQSTLGTPPRHMEDNFGLNFLRRNFHISCFDFSAYFRLSLAPQSLSSPKMVANHKMFRILLPLCPLVSSVENPVSNQSFYLCIYGGQLWSDFCAGHFVAGFSLGGWQGRSDSPTGA